LLAARLSEKDLETHIKDHILEKTEIAFDPQTMAVRGRAVRRLGALLLADHPQKVAADDETARALADGIMRAGLDRLPWSEAGRQWLERVRFMFRVEGAPWPDVSEQALGATASYWLTPFLAGKTSVREIGADNLLAGLQTLLSRDLARRLDKEVPTHFTAPTGSKIAIDYESDEPAISVRVQELFGLDRHPMIGGKIPLTFHLLSPARRPIQTTKNLPAFWRGSWADVKKDMRGEYPKHPWPDDPIAAPPTRRAKPRNR